MIERRLAISYVAVPGLNDRLTPRFGSATEVEIIHDASPLVRYTLEVELAVLTSYMLGTPSATTPSRRSGALSCEGSSSSWLHRRLLVAVDTTRRPRRPSNRRLVLAGRPRRSQGGRLPRGPRSRACATKCPADMRPTLLAVQSVCVDALAHIVARCRIRVARIVARAGDDQAPGLCHNSNNPWVATSVQPCTPGSCPKYRFA